MAENLREKKPVTVDVRQLLKNLIDHNQRDPYAPVREYISNSHDATIDTEHPLIRVWGEGTRLNIEDNGCGMTYEVIMEAYTRIAGHLAQNDDLKTIGMFGIGVLSAFIAAEKLVVETRSLDEPHGWRLEWERYAETFTLEKFDKAERGTLAILHLDADSLDLAFNSELESYIARTFSLFTVPIYVGKEARRGAANANYTWLRDMSCKVGTQELLVCEECQQILSLYFHHHMISTYYACESDGTRIFLGIPREESTPYVDKHSVQFFSKGVWVQGNMRAFYPEDLSFMVGLVDSPEFKLQVSREDIFIQEPYFLKIKKSVEGQIVKFFELLSKEKPDAIEQVLQIHGTKMVAYGKQNAMLRGLFKQHYRFYTTSGELRWREILSYAESQENGRRVVFYTNSEITAVEQIQSRGHYKSFLCVFVFGPQQIILEQVATSDNVILRDVATLEEDGQPIEVPAPFQQLANKIKDLLIRKAIRSVVFTNLPGEKQVPTMFRIRTSGGTLMHPVAGEARQPHTYSIDALMLNIAHPLISRLAGQTNLSRRFYEITAETLYQIAVLHSPFMDVRSGISDDIIDNLVQSLEMRAGLKKRPDDYDESTADCFVALPYSSNFNNVWVALSQVLSSTPYRWKVIRADEHVRGVNLLENILTFIKSSRRFAADISGLNPNVLIEVGLMIQHDPERLLILCDEETHLVLPVDLKGMVLLLYPAELRDRPEEFVSFFAEKIKARPGWSTVVGPGA